MNASLMLIRAIVHGSFVMNTEVPDFTSHVSIRRNKSRCLWVPCDEF